MIGFHVAVLVWPSQIYPREIVHLFFDKFYGLVTFTFFARSVRFAKDTKYVNYARDVVDPVMSPLSRMAFHLFSPSKNMKIRAFVVWWWSGAVYSQVWKCDSMRSNKIMLCSLAEK